MAQLGDVIDRRLERLCCSRCADKTLNIAQAGIGADPHGASEPATNSDYIVEHHCHAASAKRG
jgi:hypothetical protein